MSVLQDFVRKLGGALDIVRAFSRGMEKAEGVEVYGRPEFRRAALQALGLLRENSLPSWDTLRQHRCSILEGRRTEYLGSARSAMIMVNARDFQEPEFLAAYIAAMACGLQVYWNYSAGASGRPVPRDVYSGSAAFDLCDKAYQEALVTLGKTARPWRSP